MWYRESFSNCLYSTTVWASSWNACSPAVSRRVLPMTTSAGSSTARHVSRPRYAENASTIGARQTDCSRLRTAVMVLPPTSTVPRGICKRRPMLMARKNTACRTRWVISSMTPNASCASTSKGVRSSSRARVEHVFGFMTNSMKGIYVRTIGLARATFSIIMMNLTYNLCRYCYLKK